MYSFIPFGYSKALITTEYKLIPILSWYFILHSQRTSENLEVLRFQGLSNETLASNGLNG